MDREYIKQGNIKLSGQSTGVTEVVERESNFAQEEVKRKVAERWDKQYT